MGFSLPRPKEAISSVETSFLLVFGLGKRSASALHFLPDFFLSLLDFLAPIIPFGKEPCCRPERCLCSERKTSSRSCASVGPHERQTCGHHGSAGRKGEKAPVPAIACSLDPFVKKSWKRGFGVLVAYELK